MTKAVLERALDAEMADHLSYDVGDPAGMVQGFLGNEWGYSCDTDGLNRVYFTDAENVRA